MYFIIQILLIDPGNYRQIDELVRTDPKGTTQMEVLSLKEVVEGDTFLDWSNMLIGYVLKKNSDYTIIYLLSLFVLHFN